MSLITLPIELFGIIISNLSLSDLVNLRTAGNRAINSTVDEFIAARVAAIQSYIEKYDLAASNMQEQIDNNNDAFERGEGGEYIATVFRTPGGPAMYNNFRFNFISDYKRNLKQYNPTMHSMIDRISVEPKVKRYPPSFARGHHIQTWNNPHITSSDVIEAFDLGLIVEE
jgi:hypothetical protein